MKEKEDIHLFPRSAEIIRVIESIKETGLSIFTIEISSAPITIKFNCKELISEAEAKVERYFAEDDDLS